MQKIWSPGFHCILRIERRTQLKVGYRRIRLKTANCVTVQV